MRVTPLEHAIRLKEIQAVKSQIVTVDELMALFPRKTGELPSRNAVVEWLYNPKELGDYSFKVGNTPCILRQHIGDWQPPYLRPNYDGRGRPVSAETKRFQQADIGKRLRDARKALGRTQIAVAADAGISNNYLGDLEAGRKVPAPATLARLDQVLGTAFYVEVAGALPHDDHADVS